tara:strand:+ start:576 stop:791 length:216 start_codon:yes stop_codon:yes gene_type:complete
MDLSMSMIKCHLCETVVDTDYNVEGIWPAVAKRNWQAPAGTYPDYVCWGCCQQTEEKTLNSWGFTEDGEEI